MLTIFEKVLLLQDVAFFGSAQSEHMAQLAAVCREVEVAANSCLFREGDASGLLYLVISGKVRLESDQVDTATEISRDALDPWAFLAEMPHTFAARVLEPATLLAVSREDFTNLLTAEPEFAVAILKHLAKDGFEQLARLRPAR